MEIYVVGYQESIGNSPGAWGTQNILYYFWFTGAIVTLSKKWKLVPKQEKSTISHSRLKYIPAKDSITIELNAENCIKSLEHVVSPIGVSLGARGDLRYVHVFTEQF